MGLAEGFNIGLKLDTLKEQQEAGNRAQKQLELTALASGYEIDQATGSYKATENMKQRQDIEKQQQQAMLQAMSAELESLKADKNATGITNTLSNIVAGNWEDANLYFNSIRESLKQAKGLDVTDIGPVNFRDPRDLQQLREYGITDENFNDVEVQNALTRSMIKVTGHDGNTRLVPTDSVMKQTNTYNMMKSSDKDLYTQYARNVNSILTGKGILKSEQEASDVTTKALTEKANIAAQKDRIMSEAIATGDPKEVMQTLMLTEPEKFIGSAGKSRRDALEQAWTAFMGANPNPTEAQVRTFYRDFLQGKTEGVGAVAKERDTAQLTYGQVRALSEEAANMSDPDALKIENEIFSNLPEKQQKSVQEDRDRMKSNFQLSNNLVRILNTSGKKIDKDVIADAKTWVVKKLGLESEQTLANVDFNTRAGALLANFIKELSGTAAGEKEVTRLKDVLLGGDLTDEVYVKKAITTFANELNQQNVELGKALKDTSPYSTRKYSAGTKPLPRQQGSVKPSAADFD